jgi:predicted nuclease of predicted toxin-antitoxin system
MSVAVKLDENLGRTHVEILRKAGYEADRVHDQGLSGAPDTKVWEHVCSLDRFLITLDLGFSDVRRYPPGTHPGILLIRSRSRSRMAVVEILSRVIAERSLDDLRGCLAVADDSFTRIRRAPSRQS